MGEKASDSRIIKTLNATQRPYIRAISRAYRTAPNCALQVLTGIPPWHLEANKKYRMWRAIQDGEVETQVVTCTTRVDQPKNATTRRQIYADGSKNQAQTKAAIVVDVDGVELHRETRLLPSMATSDQAEREAITMALNWIDKNEWVSTEIVSDAKTQIEQIEKNRQRSLLERNNAH